MTRFAIDTNLYIRALRDAVAAEALDRFMSEYAPRCYLNSVVLHELLMGAPRDGSHAAIEKGIADPITRRGRVITPSHRSWRDAGTALARLSTAKKIDLRSAPRSMVNDALIAASCGEAGVTLVTDNVRDFARLRSVLRFEYASPWPDDVAAG